MKQKKLLNVVFAFIVLTSLSLSDWVNLGMNGAVEAAGDAVEVKGRIRSVVGMVGEKTLTVKLLSFVSQESAQRTENYTVEGYKVESAALTLKNPDNTSGKIVTLTLDKPLTRENGNIAWQVKGVQKSWGNEVFTQSGLVTPVLAREKVEDDFPVRIIPGTVGENTLTVEFDDDVLSSAAQWKKNYVVEGYTVESATLSGRTVTLTVDKPLTEVDSDWTVIGVEHNDYRRNRKVITQAGSIKPPLNGKINNITAIVDEKKLTVEFEEDVLPESAETKENYSVEGYEITSAILLGRTVTLTVDKPLTADATAWHVNKVKHKDYHNYNHYKTFKHSGSIIPVLKIYGGTNSIRGAVGKSTLTVEFEEDVLLESAEMKENYRVKTYEHKNNTIVLNEYKVESATLSGKIVTLTIDQPLLEGVSYLSYENIKNKDYGTKPKLFHRVDAPITP